MLIVALLSLVALAAAEHIPLSAPQSPGNRPFPNNSCMFLLWQRQQSAINYVQLNTISDYANDIRVDIAAQRPATAFSSYTRLDDRHALVVTGLLDEKNLTITHLRNDELAFTVDEIEWSTQSFYRRKDASGKWRRAACNAWDWEGSAGTRERRLVCSFSCDKVADDDRGDIYSGVEEGEGQVNIEL
ncbi:hypothetical protein E8E12_005975 [Didymella heteroderae]|uniref:Uncharacterized protein n=1 Tax=Didymella heteroderae TaxID=1769908 RepID=A0A9P5C2F4_9PLEO|nr:hypothetical protein E8E12_005975 [Didymella heteroderae]